MTAQREPGSLTMLERRLTQYALDSDQTVGRVRVTMGQTVVAQMLPNGFIKGGVGLKFRLGAKFARDSKDLDTALRADRTTFLEQLRANLAEGWGPFTGTVLEQPQRPRDDTPTAYLMQPYAVKLNAYNRSFCTVTLEVGYDELNATDEASAEYLLPQDILDMFEACGLAAPQAVPVLATHHQIAQKIHACTGPGSERARDLVDLQLLWPLEDGAIQLAAETTLRLFRARRQHEFPGRCVATSTWSDAYSAAAIDLPVRQSVDEAIMWLNVQLAELAARIAK